MMKIWRLLPALALCLWSVEAWADPIVLTFPGINLTVDGEFINAVPVPVANRQFSPLFQAGQTITVTIAFDTNQPDVDPSPNTGTYRIGMLSVSIPELGLSAVRTSNNMQISAFNNTPNPDDQFFAFVNGVDSFSNSVGLPNPTSFSALFFGNTAMLANDQLPTSPLAWTFGDASFDFIATDGTFRQVLLTFTPAPANADTTPPLITPHIAGTLGDSGWYRSNVTLSWSVIDPESGIASSTGCGATALTADTGGVTLTCSATNGVGLSTSVPVTIKIDKTPPVISGLPASDCTIWPPNDKLVQVAVVSATDALSGTASFNVAGTSNEQSDPNNPSIVITGSGLQARTVQLLARRLGTGAGRIYTITSTATDLAGNSVTASARCTVPHDQGK